MNEYFSVNANELRDKYRTRCNNRTKIYIKLLEKCYYRINTAGNNDENYCIYPIPDFILGMPTYNLAYCAAFIIHDLKKNGFDTQFFNPNIILIRWNYDNPSYLNLNNKKLITFGDNKLSIDNNKLLIDDKPKIIEIQQNNPTFRSITDYKPTGNFIYN